MIIIMLGPQGSGKGTHSDILGTKLGLGHLSMGEALREAAKEKTALGKRIEGILNKGELVPFELTIEILKNEMKKPKYKKGIILDGFPRNMQQVQALDKMIKVDKVVEMDLPDDEAIKRLGGRWMCKCGEIYNIPDKTPARKGVCDKCNCALYQREDDKPAAIKKRLKIYHEETEPVIKHYEKLGIVAHVDCRGSIDDVAKRVEKAVKG